MILVTGANGCIGYELIRLLCETEDTAAAGVRALVRSESAAGELPNSVERIVGALEGDPAALRRAVRDTQIIFHTAAKVHAPGGSLEEFARINVQGTKSLLDACRAEKVRPRFVFFSTVAVYGETTPREGISEEEPPAPHSPYAQSKVEAEKLIQAWGEQPDGGVPVVLRVATVYGPRDRGNMVRMMDAVARGRFLLPNGGYNRKTVVGVENAARFALAAACAPAETVQSRPFVVADPEGPCTLRDLARSMATALKISPRLRTVPLPLLSLLATGVESTARLTGRRAPLSREQVDRLAADNVYTTTAWNEIVGDKSAVSMSLGMARTAAWWAASQTRR